MNRVSNISEDSLSNFVVSGDRLPEGTTKVTCRANDIVLNEGLTLIIYVLACIINLLYTQCFC